MVRLANRFDCKRHGSVLIRSKYVTKGKMYTLLQCGCKHVEDALKLNNNGKVNLFPKANAKPEPKVNPVNEKSLKNEEAYDFQKTGIQFVEGKAKHRAIILDQMGLGKTVQALLWIRRNNIYPVLIVVKPSLIPNWWRACVNWLGHECLPIVTIDNAKSTAPKGGRVYIASFDMLWKKRALLCQLGFKGMVVDEVQHMKNMGAKRTFACRAIAEKAIDETGNTKQLGIKRIVALSGTPIKNRGTEFYPVLNMVRPDLFPSEADFVRNWIRFYYKRDKHGTKVKIGGIRNLELFKDYTRNLIIRRLRDEVLPDLPKIDRQNSFVDMSIENKVAYAKMYKQFEAFMNSPNKQGKGRDNMTILQFISNMRQICAIAKAEYAADHIEDFLESEESKITVFTHHHLAIKVMCHHLDKRGIEYLRFKSKEDMDNIDTFNEPDGPRVLVASTQSAGEGLNLQYQCHHCLFLERQWNPANEEQAEGRFSRIGAKFDSVTAVYLIALATIDEWMTELIEEKRVSANIDKQGEYGESDTIRKIASILMQKGLPRWELPRY